MNSYNLNLVTAAPQLEPIIKKAVDKLFELKNQRDDALIAYRKGLEAAEKKAKAIQKAITELASKQAGFASETDPRKKQKLEGEVKIAEGNLLKLNVPAEVEPVEILISKAKEAAQLNREIEGEEDFIAACNARKAELQGGN